MRPQPRGAAPEPVVLLHAELGERAAGADGAQRQPAQPLGLVRRRLVEQLLRDHPLGQVVQALEPLAAGDHEPACGPERLEHPLGRLPVPHPAAALALEVA